MAKFCFVLIFALTFSCQFGDCSEETFQEMMSKLLENQRIPLRIKQRILFALVSYMENEMSKFTNDPNYCPETVPKHLCQMPPTFYIWMRKFRDELILEEIYKSKVFFSSSFF